MASLPCLLFHAACERLPVPPAGETEKRPTVDRAVPTARASGEIGAASARCPPPVETGRGADSGRSTRHAARRASTNLAAGVPASPDTETAMTSATVASSMPRTYADRSRERDESNPQPQAMGFTNHFKSAISCFHPGAGDDAAHVVPLQLWYRCLALLAIVRKLDSSCRIHGAARHWEECSLGAPASGRVSKPARMPALPAVDSASVTDAVASGLPKGLRCPRLWRYAVSARAGRRCSP